MDEDFHWGRFQRPSKLKKELPEDWRPARELSPYEEERLEDMRLWATAHGVEMANWEAFFEIWMRRHTKAKGHGNGKSGSVLAAADRLNERFEREGATGDYVPGSSGPQPLPVDQPACTNGVRRLPAR